MVAGSAALLIDGFDTNGKGMGGGKAKGLALSPLEVKALLMNNGETNILSDALTGALAPITRIGGGEVRVDRALGAPAAAWDADVPQGALSFGFVDVADDVVTLTRRVRVHNYSNEWRTYDIVPTFRFADDIAGKSEGTMTVIDYGPFPGNTQELGMMLLTNGDRGTGARGGATQDTEAILFMAP